MVSFHQKHNLIMEGYELIVLRKEKYLLVILLFYKMISLSKINKLQAGTDFVLRLAKLQEVEQINEAIKANKIKFPRTQEQINELLDYNLAKLKQ